MTCLNANYFRHSKYRTDVGNTSKPTNTSGRHLGLANHVTWTHIAPSVRDISVSESRKVPEMSIFDRIRVIPGALSPERNYLAHPNQRTFPEFTRTCQPYYMDSHRTFRSGLTRLRIPKSPNFRPDTRSSGRPEAHVLTMGGVYLVAIECPADSLMGKYIS